MNYQEVFSNAEATLAEAKISPRFKTRLPISPSDIQIFQLKLNVVFPADVVEFYTSFSNGVDFEWATEDRLEMGHISLPSLAVLERSRILWLANVRDFADDPKSMDQCIDPEYRPRAFEIWNLMRNWLPICREGEGDAFCIRLTDEAIVFDKHDWFDGFGSIAETNGLIVAESFSSFIARWADSLFAPLWFTDSPHKASQTHLDWP